MANVSSSNGLEKRPRLAFRNTDGSHFPCWRQTSLGCIIEPYSEKVYGEHDYEVLTSSREGLQRQEDHFGSKQRHDTDGYNIIPFGYCTYRNRSDDGKFAFNINTISEKAIVSKFYPVFRFTNANSTFMAEFLNSSPRVKKKLSVLAVGTSQVVLSFEALKAAKFDLPCKDEQDKIAAFFECLNTRIENQRTLVAALKKYKRGLVFHIFRGNNPFGFEMKVTPMNDLLHEYRNRDTVNLRVCSVAVNKGVVDQVEHLGRSFAAADTSNYGRVKPGDVVYTKSPTGCFPYGIVKQNWMDEEVAVSPLYGVYTPVSKDAGYLLHTYFEQSQNANNYIRTLAQKGAKNTINITTSHFLDKSIIFPSHADCVSQLAKMFAVISAEISLAEKELELLLRQRKTLLQQLFI